MVVCGMNDMLRFLTLLFGPLSFERYSDGAAAAVEAVHP